MGYAKWEGTGAIVKSANVTEAPTTGYKYPVCKGVSFPKKRRLAQRKVGWKRVIDRTEAGGFEYEWSMSGIEPNANIFGYLAALGMGLNSYALTVVTITPADGADIPYCNVLRGVGYDLGTSMPTERLVGAKVGTFALEVKQEEFAVMSCGGMAADMGAVAAALVPSVPTGANEAPLSWSALKAGYFKVGVAGGAVAADNDITGFKLEFTQSLFESGRTLGSVQPARIIPGMIGVTFDIEKEFSGVNALAQRAEFLAGGRFAIDFKFLMGAYYVMTKAPIYGYADSGDQPGDVASDGDDLITASLHCVCQEEAGVDILAFDVVDGSTAVYWA